MRSLGPEEIMPCWYYDKKDIRSTTPSVRDGLDPDVEARYRKEGARFIMKTGTKMRLHCETLATGIVYFHRFYMFHSFKHFPKYITACCCLFLAGKVEETPKKCKDIIKSARALLTDDQFSQFGEDPKEEVMTLERILLQTIKFDLQVEHPYKFLLKYAKCLKGDKQKLEKMVQMAWTFVNDSLCTTLCLQWEPEIIAIALMYLASKLTKFEVNDWSGRHSRHQRWWDMFVEDISMELLEDVCHQVLDLYSDSNTKNEASPPQTPPSHISTPSDRPLPPTGGAQPSESESGQPSNRKSRQEPPSAMVHVGNIVPVPLSKPAPAPVVDTSIPMDIVGIEQPIPTVSHNHGVTLLADPVAAHAMTMVASQATPSFKYSTGGLPSMMDMQFGAAANAAAAYPGYHGVDQTMVDGPQAHYGHHQPSSGTYMTNYEASGYPHGYPPSLSLPQQPQQPQFSPVGHYPPPEQPPYQGGRGSAHYPPNVGYPAPGYPTAAPSFGMSNTPPNAYHHGAPTGQPHAGAPVRITGRQMSRQNWQV